MSASEGRFSTQKIEYFAGEIEPPDKAPETVLKAMRADKIISTHKSPDVPFDRSTPIKAASTAAALPSINRNRYSRCGLAIL